MGKLEVGSKKVGIYVDWRTSFVEGNTPRLSTRTYTHSLSAPLRLSSAPSRHVRLRWGEDDRGRDSPVLTSMVDRAGCLGAVLDAVDGCRY